MLSSALKTHKGLLELCNNFSDSFRSIFLTGKFSPESRVYRHSYPTPNINQGVSYETEPSLATGCRWARLLELSILPWVPYVNHRGGMCSWYIPQQLCQKWYLPLGADTANPGCLSIYLYLFLIWGLKAKAMPWPSHILLPSEAIRQSVLLIDMPNLLYPITFFVICPDNGSAMNRLKPYFERVSTTSIFILFSLNSARSHTNPR